MPSPSKLNRSRLLAALLVAPLALVACGGDDDDSAGTGDESVLSTPEEEPSEVTAGDAPSVSATTIAEPGESDEGADREQWIAVGADSLDGGDREIDECLAAGVVDGVGYENLAASGTTPEDFWSTPDISGLGIEIGDLDGVAENLDECGDLVDYFAELIGGTDLQAECMREFFDDEDIAAVIVTSMLGAEPSDELMTKQTEMRACAEES